MTVVLSFEEKVQRKERGNDSETARSNDPLDPACSPARLVVGCGGSVREPDSV